MPGHVDKTGLQVESFPRRVLGAVLCVCEREARASLPKGASVGRKRLQGAIACCVARQQGGQVCRLATREVGRAVAQRPVAFPTVSLCVARRSGCRGPGGCRNPCPLCVGSRAAMADISGSGEPGRRAGDAGSWDGCSACSCGETCHGLGRTSSCQCGRLGAVVSTRMHPSTQTHPRSNGTAAFTRIVSP